MIDRTRLTGQRQPFPHYSLEPSTADDVALPRPRRSLVALLIHDTDCHACVAYAESVFAERSELDIWDADIALVPAVANQQRGAGSSIRVYSDPQQRLANAARVQAPALIVVDQWGDITDVFAAGDGHAFPAVADVITAARYLATQCPECEGEAL